MANPFVSFKPQLLKDVQHDVMVAIQYGYLEILELVKKRHSKFNFNFVYEQKQKSFTPLLYACKCNQTDIVKWLLKIPYIFKKSKTELNETALILACNSDHIDMELILELLVNGDQMLGSKDRNKLTALHIACSKGHVKLAEQLLRLNNAWVSMGLEPPKVMDKTQLGNSQGNTPFMMAVQKNHQEIVEMWLELEKELSILRPVCEDKNKKGHNAVMMAVKFSRFGCLEKMAECNAISDEIMKSKTKCGWNVFHCAAASGDLDIFKWLLSWNKGVLETHELLDGKTEKGYTPFLLACEYHHFEIVEHLLELEEASMDLIIIDEKTNIGMTGLHLAAKHDAVDIVDLLLKSGEIDMFETDKEGNTILHVATMKSSTKVEKRLKIDVKYEALQRIKNKNGLTAENIRSLIHVPPEIRRKGKASVEAYLNALSKGKTRINQCNLIVLGEARVGKTSLIRSILNMEFEPECESTQGVQLDQIEFAESVDITISNSQLTEVGKQVKPMERVDDRITDTVALAVNEVAPNKAQDQASELSFPESSVDELKRNIIRNIKKLVPRQTEKPPTNKQSVPLKDSVTKDSSILEPLTSSPPPFVQIPNIEIIRAIKITPARKARKNNLKRHSANQVKKSQDESASVDKLREIHRQSSVSYEESNVIRKKMKSLKKQTDQDLTFHTMDFAGQDLYRPMHHCFITNRAIYLVVFKLTEVLNHIKSISSTRVENPISEIRYWLNNIIAHGAGNGHTDSCDAECPRIFLVGTFKNGDSKATPAVPPLTVEDLQMVNHRLMEVFIIDLKEKRYESSIQLSKDPKEVVFCLENSISKNDRLNCGIVPLIRRIRQLRDKIPFLAKHFPTSYLKFEKKVLQMKEKRKDMPMITTRKEVEGWAREAGIEDDTGINTAIQFYHDVRVIVDQTLISSPFKVHRQPTLVDSTVLLSPQCLATIMTAVVKLQSDTNPSNAIPIPMMKIVDHYGIIDHESLVGYLFSELGPKTNDSNSAILNVLEILESYCLIYKLSDLHHKLLDLPSTSESKNGHYLIPMKLPPYETKQDKLVLHSSGYKFEFDFQSYLPTEVYIHTICFFLSTLESEHGTDMADCVVLTDSCSKFMFVQLDNLPKAHWIIKLDQNLHQLQFEIVPMGIVENPCQFIKAVAERILVSVCVNGSLGYFKYRGGVMDKCSKTGKDVLVPYVTFESGSSCPSFKEEPHCPDCMMECKNINQILAKMLAVPSQSNASDKTVCATSIDPIGIYREYEARLIKLLSSSPLELANTLYSKDLVDRKAKDDAMIPAINDYEKTTRVLNCFYCVLDADEDKKDVLEKFCDVVHLELSHEKIIDEMKKKLENCRD